eukprot:461145_1
MNPNATTIKFVIKRYARHPLVLNNYESHPNRHRMIITPYSKIPKNVYEANLLNINDRQIVSDIIVESILKKRDYIKLEFESYQIADILFYHMLISKQWNKLLLTLKTHITKLLKLNTLYNFVRLWSGANNYLFVKYILSNRSMWKPLFLFCIKALKYLETVDMDCDLILKMNAIWSILSSTSYYWSKVHIEFINSHYDIGHAFGHFAIIHWLDQQMYRKDSNFTLELSNIYLNPKYNFNHKVMKVIRSFSLRPDGHFLSMKHPVNLCKTIKNNTLKRCNAFTPPKSMKCTKEFEEYFSVVPGLLFEKITKEDRNEWKEMKYCAWIHCNADANSSKLYICKGCKLVFYCNRNHQKKHWKLVHGKQCMSLND